MKYYIIFLFLFLFNNLLSQIALPTFHGIQKPDPPIPYVNYALEFDGNGDNIQINGSDLNPPWTVEVWFKNISNNYNSTLLWRCGSPCWALKLLQYNNTKKIGITKYGNTDWKWNYITSVGKWEHVVWVGKNNNVELFVNGVSKGTKNLSNAKLYWKYIGKANGTLTIHGEIDELRIWNDARTATEIKSNMFKELEGNESNLKAYYKMSNGSGTTLTDNSTNSKNGTMKNGMNSNDWVDSYVPIGFLNDDYETDIEGLWRMTGTNASQPSNGLTMSVSSMLNEENFVVFGNNNLSSTSTSNLPVGVAVRSKRIWHLDKTGTVETNVILDISDVTGNNPTVGASSNYKLLYRSGTSGDFSVAATANGVSGDNITFSTVNLNDGYYCIGVTQNNGL
tara:strand:- start:487 stop:1668 length:1182 start_codon:yes stop_codon:yes gene_type:complete